MFFALPVLDSVGSASKVVFLRFDKAKSWPEHLVVQRGAILHLAGGIETRLDTTIYVLLNGRQVALTSGNRSWATEWDTTAASTNHGDLVVAWQQKRTPITELAHIDLEVLESSPFTVSTAGLAPNGDVLVRLSNSFGLKPIQVSTQIAGKAATLAMRPDDTFAVPLSGLVPGPQELALTTITDSGSQFDAGKITVTIPTRVSFKDSTPLDIHRNLDSLSDVIRVDCAFADGFHPKTIDFNFGQSATWLPKDNGGQLLLTLDSLPEGDHDLSLKAIGYDGTVYLSTPRKLRVSSEDSYVRYRVLSAVGPEFQDVAYSLQPLFENAISAETAVKDAGTAQKAFNAWSKAFEHADMFTSGGIPTPEGLAEADKKQAMAGMNHVFQSWMVYGKLFAKSMAESWAPIDLHDIHETTLAVQGHCLALAKAGPAWRDSITAKDNLKIAYRQVAEGLDIHPLDQIDAFGDGSLQKEATSARLSKLAWLSRLLSEVDANLQLSPERISASIERVRAQKADSTFPDEDRESLGKVLDACASALQEESLSKQYRLQRDEIKQRYPDDEDNITPADKASLDRLTDLLNTANSARSHNLKAALKALGDVLAKENLTLVTPESP